MTLNLIAEIENDDLCIDYIEVSLSSGKTVSLNWDTSYVERRCNILKAVYESVNFGEKSAAGKMRSLNGMKVVDIGMYSDSHGEGTYPLTILSMEFCEGDKSLAFNRPYSTLSSGNEIADEATAQQILDRTRR